MNSSVLYLIAPLLAFATAQTIKFFLIPSQKRVWRNWPKTGSMPSSHTATVTSLATIIFMSEGFSNLFAVVVVFSIIFIHDALVARRSIGEQGMAVLKLISTSRFAKDPLPRIALGHKPLEVLAGGVLGVIVGLIVAFFITK